MINTTLIHWRRWIGHRLEYARRRGFLAEEKFM